ncbi:UNVERIFIED_CONTAM: hypothetical protein FKN15_050147 [Acipenser sinensis]
MKVTTENLQSLSGLQLLQVSVSIINNMSEQNFCMRIDFSADQHEAHFISRKGTGRVTV